VLRNKDGGEESEELARGASGGRVLPFLLERLACASVRGFPGESKPIAGDGAQVAESG